MRRDRNHWLTPGKAGITPLHDAARNGHLHLVPKEVITSKALFQTDDKGYTTLHHAAEAGHLDQIPAEILTGFTASAARLGVLKRIVSIVRVTDEEDFLAFYGFNRDVIPELGTVDLFIDKNILMPTKDGDSVLHLAAVYSHLDQVPRELLTKKNVRLKNNAGDTPLHLAFALQTLPHPHTIKTGPELLEHVLTDESMCQKNMFGETPMHVAARSGKIEFVPLHLLTEKSLLIPNSQGRTALHMAAASGNLHRVPAEVLTVENLLIGDEYGNTPLHEVLDGGHTHQLDLFLELDLPESAKDILGVEWWDAYKAKRLKISNDKHQLQETSPATDVELF